MFWVHAMAASRHLFTAKAPSVFLKVTPMQAQRSPSAVHGWAVAPGAACLAAEQVNSWQDCRKFISLPSWKERVSAAVITLGKLVRISHVNDNPSLQFLGFQSTLKQTPFDIAFIIFAFIAFLSRVAYFHRRETCAIPLIIFPCRDKGHLS